MFFERHTHKDKMLPVYFAHQHRTSRAPKFELHWHETLEWIYVTGGKVQIQIDEKVEIFKEGDLIAIPPHLPHRFSAVGDGCSYYCMIPDNLILASGDVECTSFSDEHLVKNRAIYEGFLKIVEEYKTKGSYYKQVIRATILQITALLCRDRCQQSAQMYVKSDNNAMRLTKAALLYMEEHYAEEISGEALAEHLGFSRSYLSHVIRKVTGQSLTENLLYIRCRKARELLQNGHTVGEVVFLSGFQNASYFSRTYKRMMGVSPSAHYNK